MLGYAPDSPELADLAANWRSAYVHVPFCLRRCPYCDFAIVDESRDGLLDHIAYTEALITEIGMEDSFGPLDAINLGGGTPSRLEPRLLGRIVDELVRHFGLVDGAELSLEVNPEDWTESFGKELAGIGFNRVSIGAQSFDPSVLKALGRQHRRDEILDAVNGARSADIRSVGVDLIFGHPSESDASWDATIDQAMEADVDHISTYSLTVEPGTELSRSILAGDPAPDDDVQADRYDRFERVGSEWGLVRYEVSNHAKSGHVCRYNLATWAHGEYVAFGIGAHDHRRGRRSRNHRRPDRYMAAIAEGHRPRLGIEDLDSEEQERDRLMVGLRLAAGTPMTPIAERFLASDAGQRLADAGVIIIERGRLRVVKPMLSDAVIREALSVSVGDC